MMTVLRRFRRSVAFPRSYREKSDDPLSEMRTMLDTIENGVVSVDSRGAIVFSNVAARRLLGIDTRPFVGHVLWDLVRQPTLQQLVTQAFRGDAPSPQELSLFVPEERILQVSVIASSSQGRCVVVLRDVTELRRLERVRQDFVANVSHELRTPLTSIKGFIETLLNGAIDDPTHNRYFLQLVEEDVNRLARLTEDLLELAKIESLGKPKTLQPVDVVEVIQDVVAALGPQVKARRLTVTTESFGPLPKPAGDPDQLRQVFWNLLDNAVKYNVEGGRIIIRLRYHKALLYADVEDSGIGIPSEDLPRLFERFYRVDKARSRALGGTGLGLAIVKHIVEAHDGEISVESEPGRGSTFRVVLPIWRP